MVELAPSWGASVALQVCCPHCQGLCFWGKFCPSCSLADRMPNSCLCNVNVYIFDWIFSDISIGQSFLVSLLTLSVPYFTELLYAMRNMVCYPFSRLLYCLLRYSSLLLCKCLLDTFFPTGFNGPPLLSLFYPSMTWCQIYIIINDPRRAVCSLERGYRWGNIQKSLSGNNF